MSRQNDRRPCKSHRTYASVVRMLADGEHTCQEMAAELDVTVEMVRKIVESLADEDCAYVYDWAPCKDGSVRLPIWRLGSEEDAEKIKLKPKTRAKPKPQIDVSRIPNSVFQLGARSA